MAAVKLAPLLVAAACARFDANETIELVPASTWTPAEVDTLGAAALCWNLQFGLSFDVVDEPSTAQAVDVQFNDFTCWASTGRFTPGSPAQIDVCPPEKWTPGILPHVRLFMVLDHELGHAAGIRSEGHDEDAVMGKALNIGRLALTYQPTPAFAEEDMQLLKAEASGLTRSPICAGKVMLVWDAETGAACRCDAQ